MWGWLARLNMMLQAGNPHLIYNIIIVQVAIVLKIQNSKQLHETFQTTQSTPDAVKNCSLHIFLCMHILAQLRFR